MDANSKKRGDRGAHRAAATVAPAPGHTIWDRPGYLVRRLHQIHVAMFLGQVAAGGVTPTQYGLLSILVRRPNIDQLTIGEELGLDRILKRLESKELVTRVVDPANRRRKLCLATARGAALVRRHHQDMQNSQNLLLNPLSPAEREVFMGLLARLVEGNNDNGRTSLRPDGLALDAGNRVGSAASAQARRPRKAGGARPRAAAKQKRGDCES